MKKITIIASVVVMLLTAGFNSVFAQDPGIVISDKAGWHKIGEVKADLKIENESIVVLGADEFKSIKLKVTDAPININKVTVYYESGETEDIEVSDELKAGEETKVFSLKHPTKDLKKVEFTYVTMKNNKDEKAHVELYGLK